MNFNFGRMPLVIIAFVSVIGVSAFVATSQHLESGQSSDSAAKEAVLKRLAEIQTAAESLDSEKVFSFVLENDSGVLIQNGKLLPTRAEALRSTQQGFEKLRKVEYHFDQQRVTLLSPAVALAVGEGTSSATTDIGQVLNTPFAQTVVLVLTNGEWKVLHAHRSFPPAGTP